MKKDLKENWGVNAAVVYDKPNTAIFRPLKIEEKHELFLKLGFKAQSNSPDETLFTIKKDNQVTMKPDRPVLLISSTSWTKDEVIHYINDLKEIRILVFSCKLWKTMKKRL